MDYIKYYIKCYTISLEKIFSSKLSCDVASTLRHFESRPLGVEITFLSHRNLCIKTIFFFLNFESFLRHMSGIFLHGFVSGSSFSHSQGESLNSTFINNFLTLNFLSKVHSDNTVFMFL